MPQSLAKGLHTSTVKLEGEVLAFEARFERVGLLIKGARAHLRVSGPYELGVSLP